MKGKAELVCRQVVPLGRVYPEEADQHPTTSLHDQIHRLHLLPLPLPGHPHRLLLPANTRDVRIEMNINVSNVLTIQRQ